MNALKNPPERDAAPHADEAATVIDTSKMSSGQRAALEMTEAARDAAAGVGA